MGAGCGKAQLKDLMASGSETDSGITTGTQGTDGVATRRTGYAAVTQPPAWRGKESFIAEAGDGTVLCEYEWRTDNLNSVDPSAHDALLTNCADRSNAACRFSFTILRQSGEVKAGADCDQFNLSEDDAEGQGYGYHDDYDDGSGGLGVKFLTFEDDESGACCWSPMPGTASFKDNEIQYDYPTDE
jgi:hypothetical protein